MRSLTVLLLTVLSLGNAAAQEITKDKAERAFDIRNKVDMEVLDVKSFPQDWLRDVRWKSIQKKLTTCPAISELTSASVTKTVDTGDWVIYLQGVDGATCSLWLKGSTGSGELCPIRSISPY